MKAPIDPVGHLGHIHGLAFSPDGKTIFSASGDYRSIFQWDANTGKELRRLAGPQRVFCLDLSRDGKTLAVGGAMHSIDFWDVATGDPIHPYAGPQGRAFCVAFSPDGKMLASGGDDQVIHLWETATWQERAQLRGHEFYVLHLQFSADGRTLASGSEDFTARVWDVASGQERFQFAEKHTVMSRSIALAPNRKLLAGGGTVWDLATGKVMHRFTNLADPSGRDTLGKAAAFSPDSQILALFSSGGIWLCDPVTGRLLRRLDLASSVSSTAAFSSDGKALLTGGSDKKLHLWEVATGRERRSFAGHEMPIHSVAISADGKMLASASGSFRDHEDDSVRLWDAATGKELHRFTGHRNVVVCVAFSPDSKTVASASEDNTVLIWDAAVFAQAQPPRPSNLSAKELESLFAALAGEDASKAYQAICTLAITPKQTPVLLQECLQAVPAVDPEWIVQLVADLDSARFAAREQATQELERLGELAESALHKALAGKPSLEVRQRLEGLLAKLQGPVNSSEKLRALRAIEVLEHSGTPEAQQVLKTLARGAPDARLTREARASLARLAKRTTHP